MHQPVHRISAWLCTGTWVSCSILEKVFAEILVRHRQADIVTFYRKGKKSGEMTLPGLQMQSLSHWRPHLDPYTSTSELPLLIALPSLTREGVDNDFFVTFCLAGKVFLAC